MISITNILESIETLSEDKTSVIRNKLILPDISDEDEKNKFKQTLIDFFKKHPNYENKIDWNKAKTLTRKDFEGVLSLEDSSKAAQKRKEKGEISSDIKNIFKTVGNRKFEMVGENDRWLFVAPLTYEAAVYCDSSENQGAGSRWCIGTKDSRNYWDNYVFEGSVFVMAFNKNYRNLSKKELQTNLKYMIQRDENGKYHVWTQSDNDKGSKLNIFGTEKKVADEMFLKAKVTLDKEQEIFKKEANKKVAEILDGLKKIDEYTIPEKYRKLITEVKIPSSVTSIGEYAFSECHSLTSVTIPESVTSIGVGAFTDCTGLTSVTIPDSVTNIGASAFSGCSGLTSVAIGNGVTSIRGWVFYGCSGLTSVTIPDSVTSIWNDAFDYCSGLMSVTIPDSVTNIGNYAFYGCSGLTLVTIPDSVTSIKNGAFDECPNLTVTFEKGFKKSVLKKKSFDSSCKFIFK